MENDDMPALEEDSKNEPVDSDSDLSDDEDADDEMESSESTTCLFCPQVFSSVEKAMAHIDQQHQINFSQLKAKHHMDQYSFIKLVNCIRSEDISEIKLASSSTAFWNDEKYLKPKEYESWLSYDYDELPADNKCSANDDENAELRKLVCSLQDTVKVQSLLLEQVNLDMTTMRLGMKRMIEKDTLPDNNAVKSNCVSASSLQADDGYFSSYAHFGIHHEMLSDVIRTTSYRDALLKNKEFVAGKDVLDVGCGTSVLSIFASQAGAKTVIGIDNSDIIYNAMDIVKKNNIENVTLVKGRLEDTKLPQQKYDIIISEWMGYFLLFEGMLDSIIYARDNHLKEGGMILPNRCTMSLLGYGSDALFANHVSFWNDVYGLNMSNMRKEVMHEPLIDIVNPQHILTEANMIADLDMATVNLNYSNFTYNFKLKCTKSGKLSAFVGYFDTYFDLPEPIMFGTAPTDTPTHWKQVVFFAEQPRVVEAGDIVQGQLTCKRSRSSARSLDIIIEAFGQKYTYYLD